MTSVKQYSKESTRIDTAGPVFTVPICGDTYESVVLVDAVMLGEVASQHKASTCLLDVLATPFKPFMTF